MKVDEILRERAEELDGRVITVGEARELRDALKDDLLPAWLLDLMLSHRLAESTFTLREDDDESGLGVEMQWLTPAQIISEATEAFPGVVAVPAGYLPVGSCLIGSGDPYFLKLDAEADPPVVRIPHEAVTDDEPLPADSVELVSKSLSHFLRKADFE